MDTVLSYAQEYPAAVAAAVLIITTGELAR